MAIQSSEDIGNGSPEEGFSKIIRSRFKRILTLPLGAILIMFLSFPSQAEEPKILNSSNTFSLEEWQFLGSSIATHYGNEADGYLGRRHAASWHKATPPQFSEIVTSCCEPGIALTTAWGVEFGREVLVVDLDTNQAVVAVRIDAKPGWGVDLYEWLWRLLSPKDFGPLNVKVFLRMESPVLKFYRWKGIGYGLHEED